MYAMIALYFIFLINKFIVIREDPVPILPSEFLGFHHPGGEKHIQSNKSWVVCPGDDNTDERCSTGDVANIFESDIKDHDGT
jgi:hypothetical protein